MNKIVTGRVFQLISKLPSHTYAFNVGSKNGIMVNGVSACACLLSMVRAGSLLLVGT